MDKHILLIWPLKTRKAFQSEKSIDLQFRSIVQLPMQGVGGSRV